MEKHFWIVRFDYDRTYGTQTIRCTAKAGVSAATIKEACDAITSQTDTYPNAKVWCVNHQGKIEVVA